MSKVALKHRLKVRYFSVVDFLLVQYFLVYVRQGMTDLKPWMLLHWDIMIWKASLIDTMLTLLLYAKSWRNNLIKESHSFASTITQMHGIILWSRNYPHKTKPRKFLKAIQYLQSLEVKIKSNLCTKHDISSEILYLHETLIQMGLLDHTNGTVLNQIKAFYKYADKLTTETSVK